MPSFQRHVPVRALGLLVVLSAWSQAAPLRAEAPALRLKPSLSAPIVHAAPGIVTAAGSLDETKSAPSAHGRLVSQAISDLNIGTLNPAAFGDAEDVVR